MLRADPRLSEAQTLLRDIDTSPHVRVDRRGVDVVIHTAAPNSCIARLNTETGTLTVFVSTDMVNPLVEGDPQLHTTRDGVRLDVHDSGSRAAGERLLRWRLELELFGSQWRSASP